MTDSAHLQVDADFPGGNIVVDEVDHDAIRVHPDLRDTVGNWFYWYFRVRGGAGRTLRVQFTGDSRTPLAARGPAVSLDTGRSWQWHGADAVDGREFSYSVPDGVDEVRFAFAMPYAEENLHRFLDGRVEGRDYTISELTRSEQGRVVEMVRVGCRDDPPPHRVLMTCRHHACEMMASYVLEGVMARVMDRSEPVGQWLSDNVEFIVIPFVDKDGVEAGDQGKNRAPHDHNRDYAPAPNGGRYASVRAIRDLANDPRTGPIDLAFDVHDPAMAGPVHERIYMVGGRNAEVWSEVERFSEHLERVHVGALPYRQSSNLPYGTSWNTDKNYPAPLLSNGLFLETVPSVGMHATLEFPYASVDGEEVTAETGRQFGADLAHAMAEHLRQEGHG